MSAKTFEEKQRTTEPAVPSRSSASLRRPGPFLQAAEWPEYLNGDSANDLAKPVFEHHIGQISAYLPPSPAQDTVDQAKSDSCLLKLASPHACPFGGACHTCPVRIQPNLTTSPVMNGSGTGSRRGDAGE